MARRSAHGLRELDIVRCVLDAPARRTRYPVFCAAVVFLSHALMVAWFPCWVVPRAVGPAASLSLA